MKSRPRDEATERVGPNSRKRRPSRMLDERASATPKPPSEFLAVEALIVRRLLFRRSIRKDDPWLRELPDGEAQAHYLARKSGLLFKYQVIEPYKRDLKHLDFHLLDTGHFALEEEGPQIARLIRKFMSERVVR